VRTLLLGATGSIGRATAHRLAADGHALTLVARTGSDVEALRSDLAGDEHRSYSCDVTDEVALKELYQALRGEDHTGLVILAGSHLVRPLASLRPAHVLQLSAEHVAAYIESTRLFLSLPLSGEQSRSIVWLSSAAALRGNPGEAAYAGAKAAQIAAVRSLAPEAARKNARINAVAPGVVESRQADAFLSKMTGDQQEQMRASHLLGFGVPDYVAGPISFLLSDDARWITGTCLVVDGGLTA
jgi:NAD(P)-dependent dehydrogenase (short-subunit alcohol dehydrogenase family)